MRPQWYRLVINSANRLRAAGSIFDNDYFVDLPLLDDEHDYQFMVEAFVCNADDPPPFVVEMFPLHESNTYETGDRTTSCRIFQGAQGTYNAPVSRDTIGHYVPSRDFFRSKRITLRFCHMHDPTQSLPDDAFGDPALVFEGWTMTLVIYPLPKK